MGAASGGEIAAALALWRIEDVEDRNGRPSWRIPNTRQKADPAAIREAYQSGAPIKNICADFGIRPGSLYKIVTPGRDRTGRMGGAAVTRDPPENRL